MTNRRQFLERSMLGFGSAFLLPSLLTGCSDHIIPGPDTPAIFPPLDDGYEIDWNEAAKIAVKTGLEMIPDVGEFLGPLAEIFWPKTHEDVWGQVKKQTEDLVKKDIDAQVYKDVTADLQGLESVLDNYLLALHPTDVNGNPAPVDYERVRTYWRAADDFLDNARPHFQSSGSELPLLGLFTQFANMYLATYRDAVVSGKSWGFADSEVGSAATKLKKGISDFTTYTTTTYNNGRHDVLNTINQSDKLHNEPFNTLNKYDRQMTLLVLHFMDTWPYYDVTQYPNGANVVLTREIYSDPMGSIQDSDNIDIVIQLPPPTQSPTQLTFWAGDEGNYGKHLAAAQVTYPAGSGPGGATQTKRMGAQNFGETDYYGGTFTLSPGNPVTEVQCTYTQYYINDIILTFNDGTKTKAIGNGTGDPNAKTTTTWSFPNTLMSSILITGASYIMGGKAAACIVFGFQDWTPPSTTLRAISSLYVTSPKEHSAADFAKAFPKLGITANSITEALKKARRAHWEYVKARAKELK